MYSSVFEILFVIPLQYGTPGTRRSGYVIILVADVIGPNIHKVMISNHHAKSPVIMVRFELFYAIKYMQEVPTFAKEIQLIDGQPNRYCVTWYLYRSISGCVVVVLSLHRGTTVALTFTCIYDSCANFAIFLLHLLRNNCVYAHKI